MHRFSHTEAFSDLDALLMSLERSTLQHGGSFDDNVSFTGGTLSIDAAVSSMRFSEAASWPVHYRPPVLWR